MFDFKIIDYSEEYAKDILSWSKDYDAFYKWSANVLGKYPLTIENFNHRINQLKRSNSFYPFLLMVNDKVCGFFSLRKRVENIDIFTIGFVIVDPEYRGKGIGKKMLILAVNLAFEEYGAEAVNLRVFKGNTDAYNCYKKVGFNENGVTDYYVIDNHEHECIELEIKKPI